MLETVCMPDTMHYITSCHMLHRFIPCPTGKLGKLRIADGQNSGQSCEERLLYNIVYCIASILLGSGL